MKHHAPQYDLAGQENAFNLCGEVIREEAPKPKTEAPRPDPTPDMFAPPEATP